jgi:hypothetical protein
MEAKSLGYHGQIITQGQVAFLDMVSNFTAFERREQWIGDPAPSQLCNFFNSSIFRLTVSASVMVSAHVRYKSDRNADSWP